MSRNSVNRNSQADRLLGAASVARKRQHCLLRLFCGRVTPATRGPIATYTAVVLLALGLCVGGRQYRPGEVPGGSGVPLMGGRAETWHHPSVGSPSVGGLSDQPSRLVGLGVTTLVFLLWQRGDWVGKT